MPNYEPSLLRADIISKLCEWGADDQPIDENAATEIGQLIVEAFFQNGEDQPQSNIKRNDKSFDFVDHDDLNDFYDPDDQGNAKNTATPIANPVKKQKQTSSDRPILPVDDTARQADSISTDQTRVLSDRLSSMQIDRDRKSN